jgi:hypothetical protein
MGTILHCYSVAVRSYPFLLPIWVEKDLPEAVDKLLTVYITKCNGQRIRLYIREGFSVASAVTCVSGELKSEDNVLTGGQRVC